LLVAPELKDYYQPETAGNRLRRCSKQRIINKRAVKSKRIVKERLLFVGVILLCFFLGLYYTTLSAVVARQGYQLEKLQNEIKNIQTENERLEVVVARLSSLDRVEKVATEKLGMGKPDYQQVVFMPAKAESNEKIVVVEEQDKQDRLQGQKMFAANAFYRILSNLLGPQKAEASSI